jgi:hypothetical protein
MAMELGTFLLLLAFSYAIGVFAYDLLPGRLPNQAWRIAAYPFALIVLSEAALATMPELTPKFGGIHPFTALIAAVVGVLLDWLITQVRRPRVVTSFETHAAPATS